MPLLDGNLNKIGLWHGTIIEIQGKRYQVTKLNPVNVKIMGTDGKTYNYNRSAAERSISDNQEWDGPTEKNPYQKYLESVEAGITLGTVVNLTGPRLRKYAGDKYVCVALSNDGTFRLAKLGGDGGRYLKKIEANEVEVVNV